MTIEIIERIKDQIFIKFFYGFQAIYSNIAAAKKVDSCKRSI